LSVLVVEDLSSPHDATLDHIDYGIKNHNDMFRRRTMVSAPALFEVPGLLGPRPAPDNGCDSFTVGPERKRLCGQLRESHGRLRVVAEGAGTPVDDRFRAKVRGVETGVVPHYWYGEEPALWRMAREIREIVGRAGEGRCTPVGEQFGAKVGGIESSPRATRRHAASGAGGGRGRARARAARAGSCRSIVLPRGSAKDCGRRCDVASCPSP